jgi:hypothetical protein
MTLLDKITSNKSNKARFLKPGGEMTLKDLK